MRANKKIIICTLLLLTMLCIVGTVSAEDSLSDNIAIEDTTPDTISVDDSQAQVSESQATEASSSSDNDKQITEKETKSNEKTSTAIKENKLSAGKSIVNETTVSDFFDDEGNLKDDVTSDELIFEGEFKNKTFRINKNITLTGKNALMSNSAFEIAEHNVKISNFTFVADKIFKMNSVIFVENMDTIIENNTITYNAPDTGDSYAIFFDYADGSQIIGNTINYIGKLNITNAIKTIAIYSIDSANMIIKDNILNIKIPSIDVVYDPVTWEGTTYSAGILLENSENIAMENNDITVEYNGANGFSDTIRAVQITTADNGKISKNNITLNGHSYAYCLTLDGKKMTITNNNINSNSDNNYAAGLEIDKDSNATVANNEISAKATAVTYGIYADDWGMGSELTLNNNNITAESNTAYGIIANSKNSTITKNNITTKANYTTGVGFKNGEANIGDNNITANGSNKGTSLDQYPMVPIQTTGICVIDSIANIEDNNITSTGDYAIDGIESAVTLKNNILNGAIGIKGYVTPETISDFFDDTGIKDDEFTELVFHGLFDGADDNIGLTNIILNRTITITGDDAIFKNLGLIISTDNATVSNIKFIADENLDSLISIFGENATIKNNTITYNAPSTEDTYAIYFESADGSQLIGNTINYTGKLNSTNDTKTIAIYSGYTDNLIIKDNNITATIPSVNVAYDAYWNPTVLSVAVLLENGNNIVFENNNVKVKYNDNNGTFNSIYAVKLSKVDTAEIIGNNIELNGFTYAYGLFADGNITIKDNNITTQSDDLGAYGIQVDSHSIANIENNNINAKSNGLAYGIYSEGLDYYDYDAINEVIINNNAVNVESNTAYGVMVDFTDAAITNNQISSKGNYTLGIGVLYEEANIENNNINSNGSNTGISADTAPMIKPIKTSGISAVGTEVTIKDNNITSTNDAITAKNSEVKLTNNNLTTTGNNIINATNSMIALDTETYILPNTEKINKEIEELNETNKNLTTENQKLNETNKNLTTENQKLATEKDDANKALAIKNNEAANLQTQVGSLTEQNKQLKNDLNTANNKANDANAKIKKVKAASKAKKSKNFKITVTLNKKVKGKYVYVAFNGKSYKAKTDKNGVAKITIKKSALKKLGGKKVKYQIIYNQSLKNKSVKIKK